MKLNTTATNTPLSLRTICFVALLRLPSSYFGSRKSRRRYIIWPNIHEYRSSELALCYARVVPC